MIAAIAEPSEQACTKLWDQLGPLSILVHTPRLAPAAVLQHVPPSNISGERQPFDTAPTSAKASTHTAAQQGPTDTCVFPLLLHHPGSAWQAGMSCRALQWWSKQACMHTVGSVNRAVSPCVMQMQPVCSITSLTNQHAENGCRCQHTNCQLPGRLAAYALLATKLSHTALMQAIDGLAGTAQCLGVQLAQPPATAAVPHHATALLQTGLLNPQHVHSECDAFAVCTWLAAGVM